MKGSIEERERERDKERKRHKQFLTNPVISETTLSISLFLFFLLISLSLSLSFFTCPGGREPSPPYPPSLRLERDLCAAEVGKGSETDRREKERAIY